MTTSEVIATLQARFDEAERNADASVLNELLAEDFLSIGPKGFLMNKSEWIARHARFKYDSLQVSEVDIRPYSGAVIVRNLQQNMATYEGETMNITVRVCQVWVDQNGTWRLAGIQFSPYEPKPHSGRKA